MRFLGRMPLLASLLLLPSPAATAQGTVDPSGHWEGTIQVPNKEVKIEIDLAKNTKGKLAGTFSNPGEGLKGLTRTGDARMTPAPKSPPIAKELEGSWNGTLEFEGKQSQLVLIMANQPDGTATGTILSRDGSGLEVPIAMTQKASNVTIDVPSVSATYAGVLNAAGTELVGTWTQGPAVLPLTFRRAAK